MTHPPRITYRTITDSAGNTMWISEPIPELTRSELWAWYNAQERSTGGGDHVAYGSKMAERREAELLNL